MSTRSTEENGRTVGRRSMVRAGVWSVPVVSIAAAAPAFAAVSGNADLSTSSCTSTTTGNNTRFTVTLRNTGTADTTGLQVVVTPQSGTITSVTATGWSFSGTTGVAANQIAAGSSVTVVFTIVPKDTNSTLTFTTSNGGSFSC